MKTWSVQSGTDPRWNNSGGSETPRREAHKWLNECREKYGEPPMDTVQRITE